jgi:hypothetical protein
VWLKERHRVPQDYRAVSRLLIGISAMGFAILAHGLIRLQVWPAAFGASLIVLAQLWRIDRLGVLYEQLTRA